MNSNSLDPGQQQLLNGLNNGDPKSREALFKSHYKPLWFYVDNIIRNKDDSQDIASEAFLVLFKKQYQFDSLLAVRTFLYTTARNACIDYLRKRSVIRNNQDQIRARQGEWEDPTFEYLIKSDIIQAVYDEITKLPRQQRAVVERIFIKGLGTAEVAKELDISTQTVLNQKANGLKTLRKVFGLKMLLLFLNYWANWFILNASDCLRPFLTL